jgi:hypothetical protein
LEGPLGVAEGGEHLFLVEQAGLDGEEDAVEPRVELEAAVAGLFADEARVAALGAPELLEETGADAFEDFFVAGDGGGVVGEAGEVAGGEVALVGVGGLVGGAAAAEPDGVGGPGVDVALVGAVEVGIEALLHPFEVELEGGAENFLQLGVASPAPGVDELGEELGLHVVEPVVLVDATLAVVAGVEGGLGEELFGIEGEGGVGGVFDLRIDVVAGLGENAVVPAGDGGAVSGAPAGVAGVPEHGAVDEGRRIPDAVDGVGDGAGGGVDVGIGGLDGDARGEVEDAGGAGGESGGGGGKLDHGRGRFADGDAEEEFGLGGEVEGGGDERELGGGGGEQGCGGLPVGGVGEAGGGAGAGADEDGGGFFVGGG